jgi:hypothetical protein
MNTKVAKGKGKSKITGFYNCKKNPEREADFLDGSSDYTLAEVATKPGQIFTRNSRIEAVPYSIVDGQHRFWIEFDERRNAEVSVPIPPKFPQKEAIQNYPQVGQFVSIEGMNHQCGNPLVTFVFADTVEHMVIHLSTRDTLAVNMNMDELSKMGLTSRSIPFRYLAEYEKRPFEDLLKELTLTERYYFVGILIPSTKAEKLKG